jgi:hypothetical protein
MPLAKDTELVTFGIFQYNPRLITLANINMLCAVSHKTSYLGVLVIRPEVEMQSALSLLALIKPDEIQPRQAIRLRADLELLIRGVNHNPTKSLGPPLPQGHRIYRVNNYLFPFQSHPPSLDLPGLQEQMRMRGNWPAGSLSSENGQTIGVDDLLSRAKTGDGSPSSRRPFAGEDLSHALFGDGSNRA